MADFFLNIVAFFVIYLGYVVILTFTQNVVAVMVGCLGGSPTCRLAAVVSGVSSLLAALLIIVGVAYGLYEWIDSYLSLIPVLIWGGMQLSGIARSFYGYEPSLKDLTMMNASLASPQIFKAKYYGQFCGTFCGILLGILMMFQFR